MQPEVAVIRGQRDNLQALDQYFPGPPVGDQVFDRTNLQAMFPLELNKVRQPRHGPVFIDHLRQNAGVPETQLISRGRQPLPCARPVGARHPPCIGEERHVARPDHVLCGGAWIRQQANRARSICGRYATSSHLIFASTEMV